ncbi:unnamed protein product [Parascedosporium putredinis]|uniref:Vacuolar protein sorting-associated protein TDA6 n=1 Tax=Parascedosporium putredinis TaxID=1442378 RepID=A0A9P1H490_9PEZI|nr:unnamed protein product [Parascedosporium putredinis]CAI7995471.1 unnamed protein product [Parascedosporium putredinis]
MIPLRSVIFFVTVFLFLSSCAVYAPKVLNPVPPTKEKRREDRAWVSSSPYWLDRQACRWMGLCGLHHLRSDPPTRSIYVPPPHDGELDDEDAAGRRLELRSLPVLDDAAREAAWESVPTSQLTGQGIPKFVLDHAPLVHMCSQENFWPADIAEHIQHVSPHIDTSVDDDPDRLNLTQPLSLHNLHEMLNNYSASVFLVSDTDVEHRPEWLHSDVGIPVHSDDSDFDDGADDSYEIPDPKMRAGPATTRDLRPHVLPRQHKPDEGGYSKAPAVLILVDKGSGILDAFWFFFYSYNLGQTVLGIRFGNHVGDWEHAMVRFENGIPRGIFFSEHEGGQAYAWSAVEKIGHRPVIYSAVGSHAMYPLPGVQAYILPFKLLKDVTDRGPIWDPAKNIYAYHYDYRLDDPEDPEAQAQSLMPAEENPNAPTGWFHYTGAWGDKLYSLADMRQWRLFGQYHYVTGPMGPKFKALNREKMCTTNRCRILNSIVPGTTWY